MQNRIELQVGKWGNSLGIRLPKHITDSLNLNPKDRINCFIEDGKLILEPVRHAKYKLDELLAEANEPGEEVSWGRPRGEEVW